MGIMHLKRVSLYYDLISPYSWIGFEVFMRHVRLWNAKNLEVELKPFLVGQTMKALGNKPPGIVPAKGFYSYQDLQRLAFYFDIPFNMISNGENLKNGSRAAVQLATAVKEKYPEVLEKFSIEIWKAMWQYDQCISDENVLLAALLSCQLSTSQAIALIKHSRSQDIIDKVTLTCNEAIDLEIFGAPTFILDDGERKEIFFGQGESYKQRLKIIFVRFSEVKR